MDLYVCKLWNDSPSALQKMEKTMMLFTDGDLMKVVNCMEHAVSAVHPRTRYSPGWDAKFFWLPLSYMPSCITDAIFLRGGARAKQHALQFPSHQLQERHVGADTQVTCVVSPSVIFIDSHEPISVLLTTGILLPLSPLFTCAAHLLCDLCSDILCFWSRFMVKGECCYQTQETCNLVKSITQPIAGELFSPAVSFIMDLDSSNTPCNFTWSCRG